MGRLLEEGEGEMTKTQLLCGRGRRAATRLGKDRQEMSDSSLVHMSQHNE
jgi:hypothetical protein